MTRRKRNLTIASLLVLLVAVELGLRSVRDPVASVRIVNQGGEPIKNLRLTHGRTETRVAVIRDGEATQVLLAGRGKQTLTVDFQQDNNPLSHFEIPIFDPAALQNEGFTLVLVIRRNEYERYQDDADPSLMSQLTSRTTSWLEKSLESP